MGDGETDGASGVGDLRTLLAERVRAVTRAAVRSGGRVDAEEIEALARLARLAEIARAAEPPARPRRWPMVALVLASVGAASALVFLPMPATDIELSAAVSAVRFESAARQTLTDATALASLGAAGFRSLDVPPACVRGGGVAPTLDGAPARLSVETARTRRGTLALEPLTLPAGAAVGLQHLDRPQQYRISLGGLTRPTAANVQGPIRLVVSGGGTALLDCATPRPIVMHPAPDVDLDLSFLDALPGALQLRVRQLALARREDDPGPGGTGSRLVSTVLSGTLYFLFNGTERKLRPGEMLRFARSDGDIRTLRWERDHIVLDFRGRVRGLTTGWDDGSRSLMPSPLDWLRASQGDLAVIWGATLYVMGFAAAALRWWRNPQ
jgi:hypothetical protein